MCDGAAHPVASYPSLHAVLGTKFNLEGDAAGIFRVPDLRGRVVAGKDDMGGVAAGRLTGTGGVNGAVLGAAGGSETHTLTQGQMPAHGHTGSTDSSGGHTHTGSAATAGAHTHSGTQRYGGDYMIGTGGNGWHSDGSLTTGSGGAHSHTLSINSGGAHSHTLTIGSAGSGEAHPNTQPTLVLNYIIKT